MRDNLRPWKIRRKFWGGAGIAAAQQLIDESIEAVISSNVGPTMLLNF